jgi:hypothetical protein
MTQPKQISRMLLNLKSFLVIYALLDLIFMYVIVSRFTRDAIAAEVNVSAPGILLVTPFLLFIACIGIRIDKAWTDLFAMFAGGWLIKRIWALWVEIAYSKGLPVLSISIFKDWWCYEGIGRWEIPRLLVAIFVFAYAMFLMIRHLKQKYT